MTDTGLWTAALVARAPAGRYHTALTLEGGAGLFSHDSLLAYRLKGSAWVPFAGGSAPTEAWTSQPWHLNAAFGGGALWVVDGSSVWCARGAQRLEPLDVPPGPPPHFAHRTALVWDERSERLLIIGGTETGAVWALAQGRWHALPPGPPVGQWAAVSTREGVYVVAGNELWLLRDEQWVRLAREPSWPEGERRGDGPVQAVLCHRGTLLAAGMATDGVAEVAALEADGSWRRLGALPQREHDSHGAQSATLVHDPEAQRLLLFLRAEHDGPLEAPKALDLSALPVGGLPVSPFPSAAVARKRPPAEHTRRTWALRRRAGDQRPLPPRAPAGFRVVATVPGGLWPGVPPFAVLVPKEHGEAQAVALPEAAARPAAVFSAKEPPSLVDLVEDVEVDVEVRRDYALEPGPSEPQKSKLGGYSANYGATAEACPGCQEPRHLVARLTPDLIPELEYEAVEIFCCAQGHLSGADQLC